MFLPQHISVISGTHSIISVHMDERNFRLLSIYSMKHGNKVILFSRITNRKPYSTY